MKSDIYVHNSEHKEFIREKWVEFALEIYKDNNNEEFGIITFPAEEMQDLKLFADNGLFEWELQETGSYEIKKGKIVCFEKSIKIFRALQTKLVNAKVEPKEIGAFLRENYNSLIKGDNKKFFPVHVVNLDYDGNISKSKIGIDEIINLIFSYQKIHKRDFSFFLTWPSTEEEDEIEFKALLKDTISGNLESQQNFKMKFEEIHKAVDVLKYDNLSIIGISKILIKSACNNLFTLDKNEFYIYGEPGRRQMYSVLFNLNYTGKKGREVQLYSSNVIKSLENVGDLKIKKA